MAERTVSIEKETSRGTYRWREDLRPAEVAGDVNLAQGVPGLARAEPTRQQAFLVGEEVLIRHGICLTKGFLAEDFAISVVGEKAQVPGAPAKRDTRLTSAPNGLEGPRFHTEVLAFSCYHGGDVSGRSPVGSDKEDTICPSAQAQRDMNGQLPERRPYTVHVAEEGFVLGRMQGPRIR